VLYRILKFHEDTILKILCLQKSLSVNWTIKVTLEAKIPHEIFNVILREEVFIETMSEIKKKSLE
jgi:hypothetical protein